MVQRRGTTKSPEQPTQQPGRHITRLLAGVLSVAALISLTACNQGQAPEQAVVRPVQTMTVGRIERHDKTTYSGPIAARHKSRQGFRVGGTIARRLVHVGEHVDKGQPLLKLDSDDFKHRLAQAQADKQSARHQLDQARVALERSRTLVDKHFISQAKYDQSKLGHQQAKAALSAARARYDEARDALDDATLKAAVPGVITAIRADVGEVVGAGMDVVDIARDGDREVVISVPESRLADVQQARHLGVTLWAIPDARYDATLRVLYPDTTPRSSTYEGHVTLLNPDRRVRLGMTAYVHVPNSQTSQGHVIPLTAINNRNGTPQVWQVDERDNTVTARDVHIARLTDNGAVVTDGIDTGDVIVTAGVQMLHDGDHVKPVGTYFPQSE